MRRTTVIVMGAIAIIVIAAWAFQFEAEAIAWHVRHGFHAEGAGIRVHVPWMYTAMEGPSSLILMSPTGRLRSYFIGNQSSLLFISTKPSGLPSAGETFEQWVKRTTTNMGERRAAHVRGEREISVAGQVTRCIEFEGGPQLVGLDVWCLPQRGGRVFDYLGPPSRLEDLYSILQSAQAH